MFSKGDILEASKRLRSEGLHYIIYYSEHSNDHFIGGMITSSKDYENIAMEQSHFKNRDENQKQYKITYKDSYLVKAKLVKPDNWGPFKKVGALTPEGIGFVTKEIEHLDEMTFDEYKNREHSS